MLQHFSRRMKSNSFQTRSSEREELSDRRTMAAVGRAVDEAIAILKAEQDGLSRRFDEARERASVATGTEDDEYLLREPDMLADLQRLEDQMSRATTRLKVLQETIAGLRSVRELFHSKFGASIAEQDRS